MRGCFWSLNPTAPVWTNLGTADSHTGLFTGAYLVHVLSLAIVVLAVRSNVNVDWLAIVVLTVRSNVNVDWLDLVFFWMYSPHSGDD